MAGDLYTHDRHLRALALALDAENNRIERKCESPQMAIMGVQVASHPSSAVKEHDCSGSSGAGAIHARRN